MIRAIALVVVAGCSSVLGIDNLEGPPVGPGPTGDAPSDDPVVVPATIRISGSVVLVDQNAGFTPAENAMVVLEAGAAVAQPVITDKAGKYELVITTGGAPVDGTLHVLAGSEREVIQYFASPLIGDGTLTTQVLTLSFLQMFAPFCGGFDPALPAVLAVFSDAQGTPLPDTPIESVPMTNWCGLLNGSPVQNRTGDEGLAFGLGLPAGPVEIRSGTSARLYDLPGATTVIAALLVQ